ncbi:ester cyclase [Salinigranum halophilum]|mgnify:CR=1 FL=1|jgi:predicted ester cyclase|uniref:ester cyclase n=1 Tax=Salinigranum halophilum TaxID=2565931 RepID=UPI0010A8BEE6|nr:ester cyclase [Salinigranum halophilum]
MSHRTRTPEQLVSAYVDVWNERAYQHIPEVVSESFVLYDPAVPEEGIAGPRGEAHGPDAVARFIRGVIAGFPDFHVRVLDTLARDDVVMYEAEVTMTHEGEFDGMSPTGRDARFRLMSTYLVGDDELEEHRVYFDRLDVFAQLGLTDGE